jgi:hypothetical protein
MNKVSVSQAMLTITYFAALCIAVACWQTWRRAINRFSMGSRVRRVLVSAYWILAFTMLCDMLASLSVRGNYLTQVQFKILLALAAGVMPQVALFALIITPIAMHGRSQEHSFRKALIFMEACAVIAIIMLAAALIFFLHQRESLANAYSR